MTRVIDEASAGLARAREAVRSKAAALSQVRNDLEGVQAALAGCASAPQRVAQLEAQGRELQARLQAKQVSRLQAYLVVQRRVVRLRCGSSPEA